MKITLIIAGGFWVIMAVIDRRDHGYNAVSTNADFIIAAICYVGAAIIDAIREMKSGDGE